MKFIINNRLKKYTPIKITSEIIQESSRILFSIFGSCDSYTMPFIIIKKLIEKYYILVSKQLYYYTKETIHDIEIWHTNKRNPIEFFSAIHILRKLSLDLRFNPLGYGSNSEFFINFIKKNSFYDKIKLYLELLFPKKKFNKFELIHFDNIIITLLSIDIIKNITKEMIDKLLLALSLDRIIIVAHNSSDYKNEFIFNKLLKNSQHFKKLLKSTDLFTGVDSIPLHIADTFLKIKSIDILDPTVPKAILNYKTNAIPISIIPLKEIK